MSGVVVKIRKAQKDYRCPAVWAHDPVIRAGEMYARVKVAPYDIVRHWQEYTYHPECAEADD